MHPDLMLLAERLVTAMETMSQDVKNISLLMTSMGQDVKNMSAYVCDLSYSVSHFLREKRGKEDTLLVPSDEGDNVPSDIPASGQGAATESEHFWQYDQACRSSVLHIENQELENTSVRNVASVNADRDETSNLWSSVSSPIFSEEIKTERQSANEEYDEICVVGKTYDNGRNNIRPSRFVEPGFMPVPQEMRFMETSSNSSIGSSHATERQGGEILVAKRDKMECAFEVKAPDKPFEGVLSNKIMPTMSNVMDCAIEYSGDRRFKCSVCGKLFKESGNLKRHMILHSGEKPFKCRECGKMFSQNIHLTSHMRLHTGEKPYKCSVCGQAFVQSGSLTSHMRTHTGERQFAFKRL